MDKIANLVLNLRTSLLKTGGNLRRVEQAIGHEDRRGFDFAGAIFAVVNPVMRKAALRSPGERPMPPRNVVTELKPDNFIVRAQPNNQIEIFIIKPAPFGFAGNLPDLLIFFEHNASQIVLTLISNRSHSPR